MQEKLGTCGMSAVQFVLLELLSQLEFVAIPLKNKTFCLSSPQRLPLTLSLPLCQSFALEHEL